MDVVVVVVVVILTTVVKQEVEEWKSTFQPTNQHIPQASKTERRERKKKSSSNTRETSKKTRGGLDPTTTIHYPPLTLLRTTTDEKDKRLYVSPYFFVTLTLTQEIDDRLSFVPSAAPPFSFVLFFADVDMTPAFFLLVLLSRMETNRMFENRIFFKKSSDGDL
jgi:hypothetical protein